MFDLTKSKLFSPWTDPETGVTIYLLTHKVAPVQEAFYFVNNSMTADGRYLWFYCAFPPAGSQMYGRTLGVVDFEQQKVHHFPETQFQAASPLADAENGDVYWTTGPSIWRRPADPTAGAECVNSLPQEIVKNRQIHRLATHLSLSADGKEFFVDAAFGLQWVFGSLPVDGGDFQLWHRFDRHYNHAQFSPTDPDLVLFAEENHPDPITGLTFRIVDRMWLIRRGETPCPVFDTPTRVTHEWWDADGEHVWCVWDNDAWRTNIETQDVEKVAWPAHCWHAHISRNGDYMISDSNGLKERYYRGCPSSVFFLNRRTGKHVQILSNPEMKGIVGARYHIDPHPRFCASDKLVVFTTTVRGEVDLAVIEADDLINRTT